MLHLSAPQLLVLNNTLVWTWKSDQCTLPIFKSDGTLAWVEGVPTTI